MFKVIGRLASSYPWVICAAWLLAGVGLTVCAPAWDSRTQDDDIRFIPERYPSVRGYKLLQKSFRDDVNQSKAIFVIERDEGKLSAADFALVDQFVRDLHDLKDKEPELQIMKVGSYRDTLVGERLTSADGQCTLVQMSLGTPFLALQTRATVDRAEEVLQQRLQNSAAAPGLLTTGPAGIGRDLIDASADSLEGTTIATVILVVVVLLFVYRAPLLALVPLMTIAISVFVALKLLALMTLIPGVHLVNVAKIFAIVILYGAGTDYCLFLISRYQEELANGHDIHNAIGRSVGGVGEALAASAGTVICGLGLMGFAEFAKVRCAGPAIALSLGVALVASLTLAPALLRLMGRVVFWPGHAPSPEQKLLRKTPQQDPIWERLSRGVVARPLLVWSVAVLGMLPLALVGLKVQPNYKPTGELSPLSPSVRGVQAIQRHFTEGEIGPLTVLLSSSTDWNTPAGRELIGHLSRGFAQLADVHEVRSLTQPLGKPLEASLGPTAGQPGELGGIFNALGRNFIFEQAQRKAREFYVSKTDIDGAPRFVTRLDVVLKSDPFDSTSHEAFEQIQVWLEEFMPKQAAGLENLGAECYGVTVGARDLAKVTEADRTRVNALVLTGIFIILLVLVRSPWLAAYLLVTVLFSYWATLGATTIAGTLWTGRPLFLVDWRVPFFLFVILVAVGEDYNIFLMTRVLQEKKVLGEIEGTRRALAMTGGTITSCGLIMAGTFATLMLGGLGTLMQIGFALAFGVMLDTFVVRPFLVPAFTLLVHRLRVGKAAYQAEIEAAEEFANVPDALPVPRRRHAA